MKPQKLRTRYSKICKTYIVVFLILSIFSCADSNNSKNATLLIAAASNVQFVLDELVKVYEDSTGVKCDVVMSSSGKLTSQITSGATYDIFVSADQYYPNFLSLNDFVIGKPVNYAGGKLIFWSTQHDLVSKVDILDPKYAKIAIANPKIAPYGKAAISVLQSLEIYETMKDRLVYGENISQVNQFVNVGAADLGITSQSVVLAPGLKSSGSWLLVDESLYDPILQDVVALKNGKAKESEKARFIEFLLSKKGKQILKSFGYD